MAAILRLRSTFTDSRSPRGGLELEPGAAVGDHLGGEEVAARRRILDLAVVDARRAHQLADHDALGAVDDEGPEVRHPRVVAHVDALPLDLAGLLDQELHLDVQRAAVGQVARAALELGVLRVPELVIQELQLHHLGGEVLDRADLVEQLPQALLHEPGERADLELDEVRDLAASRRCDPGIRAAPGRGASDESATGSMKTAPWRRGGNRGTAELTELVIVSRSPRLSNVPKAGLGGRGSPPGTQAATPVGPRARHPTATTDDGPIAT